MTDILDKVIQSHEEQIKASLNPRELVSFILQDLSQREKEVVRARYGLELVTKETLESIGKKIGITRERVRQIEKIALEKARATNGLDGKLSDLKSLVAKNLSQHGNIRLEDSLLEDLLEISDNQDIDKNCLLFVFVHFLSDHLESLDIVYTDKAWKLKNKSHGHFEALVNAVKDIFNKSKKTLHLNELEKEVKAAIDEDKIKELLEGVEDYSNALHSCLEVSKHFKKNLFDKWGLINWRSVNPKRMRDKIYLVLKKDEKPLHYKRIADRINEESFDKKKAHPPTVHNELILDERFVLIGRGIYALIEWGYKPGAISQVIADILAEAGEPLSKQEIIEEVLKKRMVKEGSINLALLDKDLFQKTKDSQFTLKG